METDFARNLTQTPDLAHRLRRLAFFERHFCRHVARIAERHSLDVSVDTVLLTRAFLAWGEDFTRQRAVAAIDRRDYIVFTAGMLLIRMLEGDPITTGDGDLAATEIAAFWPRGFLYTEYCLDVLAAVLTQEFGSGFEATPSAGDLRVWWSYRENVRDDVASALGFFDLFAGSQPNWRYPTIAAHRPAIRRRAATMVS